MVEDVRLGCCGNHEDDITCCYLNADPCLDAEVAWMQKVGASRPNINAILLTSNY